MRMHPSVLEVLDRVMEAHEADAGDAQVLDPASGLLEMVAWRGVSDEAVLGPNGDGIGGWKWVDPRHDTTVCCRAFRLGQPLYISDVKNDPPYVPYLAATLASGIRAVHSIPVLVEGRCVAMVSPMYFAPRVLPASALDRSREIMRGAGDWIPASALALPSSPYQRQGIATSATMRRSP
jgi:GAF domain-containing protein